MRHAVRRLRRHQQVHVVRHQHVAVNGAAVLGRRGKPIAVARIISLIEEDCRAIIPALDDVQGLIRKKSSARAVPSNIILKITFKPSSSRKCDNLPRNSTQEFHSDPNFPNFQVITYGAGLRLRHHLWPRHQTSFFLSACCVSNASSSP